jgi:hypothetical protein
VPVVPPSLSLPHKGGGNDVALLWPTAGQHSQTARRNESYRGGFIASMRRVRTSGGAA